MFIHYTAQNLFFAELLHKLVYIEDAPYFLFPLFLPILIWLISKNIFKKSSTAFIATFIFAVSPWVWYLVAAQSIYVFLLFLITVIFYGITLVKSGRIFSGNLFITLASTIAMYSSSLFFILIPLSFIILYFSKIVDLKFIKISIISLILLASPLIFLIYKNESGFKNTMSNQIRVFSDPGTVNTANRYQGDANKVGLRTLARISENKYILYVEDLALKYSIQISPVTFFTPEYKLLGFSFSPPILLGFIIPFGYGLYELLQKQNIRRLLFFSTFLVLPSILTNESVSLNRLILFFPIVIFIVTFGIVNLYNIRKNRLAKTFLILIAVLIIFQSAIILNDLKFREKGRLEAYFGNKLGQVEP